MYIIGLKLKKQGALDFSDDLKRRSCATIVSFFKLLYFEKAYRSLFYYRFGSISGLLKLICPPYNSFYMPSPETTIGKGIFLMHPYNTIINAKSIGENFMIFQNCTIGATAHGVIPVIGDNVAMYASSMILGGVKIGNNVNIGAGCVVVKNVPDNCTVIGNPAYIVKKNGIKIYEKL